MVKNSVRWALGAALVAFVGVLVSSCGGATKIDGGTDSNTHWLAACSADAECGSFSCHCGVCTKPCTGDAGCSGLAGRVSCSASCSETTSKVCVATCSSATDCPNGGVGFSCEAGKCVAKSEGGNGGPTPDSGVATGCPATHVDGAPCNGPSGTCWTACAGGYKSEFGCDGGHWVGGLGLFPCDFDGGEAPSDSGVAPMDAAPPTNCRNSSDCRVVALGCCGFCGAPTLSQSEAVTAASASTWYQDRCPIPPPCLPQCNSDSGTISALCIDNRCEVEDLAPYAHCENDSDCTVQTTICCGACSEDSGAFVAVSDPAGFRTHFPVACTEDCVACFTDSGAPRTGPSWLHAKCDTALGACVLQEDSH